MRRIGNKFTLVSFVVLALGTILYAQDPATPAVAPSNGQAASTPASAPTAEDYRALKEEVEQLKQQMAAKDKQPATQPTPANAPTATNAPTAPTATNAQPASGSSFSLGGPNDGQVAETLFAPRTEQQYFSPFEDMNPAHIRADMPMQIGRLSDMNLFMGFQSVGRLQAITQQNVSIKGVNQASMDPGFQDPFGNLSFLASIPDKLDVYFDMYIASRPHSSTMYGHEGYLLFKQLPAPFNTGALGDVFNYVNVKVGAFDIDYGDDNYRRSNNARVQRNPLITNPLVDPNVEEIGGEIYSTKGPVYWLFGLASGTTTEHFDYGSQPSFHGKIWGYPLPELRTSISAYHADLSGSADTSYLYANGRSGGALGGVFGGGDNPGQILPQSGKDVTSVQADVTWNHWPCEIYSNIGWVQDSDTNGPALGTPSERWIYGTFEPVYHITPSLYVAGRYSLAKASSVNGASSDGWVERAEIGGGYWITRNILGKVEYVYEKYHGFGFSNGVVSGADGYRGPSFNGVVLEVSFSF